MAERQDRHVIADVIRHARTGLPDGANAALHGISRSTVQRWRVRYTDCEESLAELRPTARCPRCLGASLDNAAYAELLGWYLGDGHISCGRRDVHYLHVIDDVAYPHDLDRICDLMRLVKPGAHPHRRSRAGAVIVTSGWKHWPCLFPQDGPGRKHERPIVLEPWQREIVDAHPGAFLTGLFHSDGCRVRNWATRTVAGEPRRYEYPRWQFRNASEDILGLCCWALDLAGVAWRRSGPRTVSVSTREAVARLDRLIGLKQ